MLAVALCLCSLMPQDPPLEALRSAEAEHARMLARVAGAVCTVMPQDGGGGGSGAVIDPAGFVLTNFHVVARPGHAKVAAATATPPAGAGRTLRYKELPADEDEKDPAWSVVKVGLPDGELYLADVLGIDPGSDLAVLLLRPPAGADRDFPSVPLGDSDALLVGETVFALGNPFSLANDFAPTVTRGIVSGTHRYQPGGGQRFLVYPDCIQVDAPVNPGNSGGPLVNDAGELVGVNGRITVRERGRVNTGIGFAVSSDQVKNFLAEMMAGHHVEHGTLDLNAWFMRPPDGGEGGVFVQALFADSVATRYGVRLGDALTTFNGEAVRSANQLACRVGVLPAGTWVTLGFLPKKPSGFGAEKTVTLSLSRLDTGSVHGEGREANEAQRRLAAVSAMRRMTRHPAPPGRRIELVAGDGRRMVLERLGAALRWDDRQRSTVVPASGEAFVIEGGGTRDATAAELDRLQRMAASNALLWGGGPPPWQDDALLAGGAMVFGEPAWRLGGHDSECWLFDDGTPAGVAFHDPLAEADVELRLGRDGAARWVIGGELDDGWTVHVDEQPPAATDFERAR